MEEVTIDSNGSWKPVSIKQEIKQEEDSSCSNGPPPKRMKSVDSTMSSPMSITNPSTPGSYKPPTPATCGTVGPKTPQNLPMSSTPNNDKFALPSPLASQPQLLRQQSLTATASRTDGSCHLSPPGNGYI